MKVENLHVVHHVPVNAAQPHSSWPARVPNIQVRATVQSKSPMAVLACVCLAGMGYVKNRELGMSSRGFGRYCVCFLRPAIAIFMW